MVTVNRRQDNELTVTAGKPVRSWYPVHHHLLTVISTDYYVFPVLPCEQYYCGYFVISHQCSLKAFEPDNLPSGFQNGEHSFKAKDTLDCEHPARCIG